MGTQWIEISRKKYENYFMDLSKDLLCDRVTMLFKFLVIFVYYINDK